MAKKGDSQTEGIMDKRMLTIVFVSLVVDLLAFTMILPLLPALLDYYGNHDEGGLYFALKRSVNGFRSLVGAPDTPKWNSVLFGGVLGSLFSLLQFISSPLMGAASDVYGRRPIMLLSMVGIASSYALWAVSSNFSIFVIARIIGGISKGNVSLSTAVVADICPPSKRGKVMAVIGIAFSVGFIIGPLIGAFFSRRGTEGEMFFLAPALFALCLAVGDIVFMVMCFKETLPAEKRSKSLNSGLSQAFLLICPSTLFKFSAVEGASKADLASMRQIGTVYFLYLFFYSGLEFTLTFLTYNRFNFDNMQQGKMFFLIGAVMVLVQGGYVRRIKPGAQIKTALQGLMLVVPAFIIVGFAYSTSVLYLGLVLYSFASATVVPCLTTVISSYGTVEQKGTVLGIFRSLGALARALGPIMSSMLYWSTSATCCYCVGAVCLVLPYSILRNFKAEKVQ
jgi:MFS family permease